MSFITLMYHEIRPTEDFNPEIPSEIRVAEDYQDVLPAPLFVTKENFEAQMKFLNEQNYHTLSLAEVKNFYFEGMNIPEKSILITFDDAYQSMKEFAYPVLKKYNMHAVSFPVKSWLFEEAQPIDYTRSVPMSKAELAQLGDVFETANHTNHFHKRLDAETGLMMVESDGAFEQDLVEANQTVEGKDSFAYPFGLFIDRNENVLREMGFKLAFTSKPGVNSIKTPPLELHRNAVPYFVTLAQFEQSLRI